MKTRLRGALITIPFILFVLIGARTARGQGPEVILYQEDFQSGQARGWQLEQGWSVTGGVLSGEGHRWARYTGSGWSDYRLRFRLRISAADLHVNYRTSDQARYFIGFYRDHTGLSKQYFPDRFFNDLASNPSPLSRGTWHAVEIAGKGARLTVVVDDAMMLDYADPEAILSGGFAFESLDNSKVEIDDIVVFGPVPTPTPTPPKGYAWIRTGGPIGGLGYDVRMRPDNPDAMYVTDAWAGVHKSIDAGKTWFPSNNGIITRGGASGDAIPIFCLTIDPHHYDIIWAGTQDVRGIFKSTDGGMTWVEKDRGVVELQGITFRGFTIDPRSSNIVFAAAEISSFVWASQPRQGREFDLTRGVVYKTTDGGENWSSVWRGDNLARYVWIDPRNPDVLYISTGIFDREAANSDKTRNVAGGMGVVKSTDGGKTWKAVNNGLNNLYVGTLFMHPTDPAILLAGTGNNAYRENAGVYLSTNGGQSWTQVVNSQGQAITAVEFALSNPNIAYAGGDNAVYRSEDGGRTWQVMTSGAWGPPGARVGFPIDFQVDPRNANRLFANAYGGGNFVSPDGGKTWQVASQGYTGAEMNAILVDPTDAATVYAGGRSGFFKSTNGGAEWQPINFPPADLREGAAVAIDPTNPQRVLISDQQSGSIWASDNGGRQWRSAVSFAGQLDSLQTDDNNNRMQGVNTIVFAPSNPRIVYAGFAARWCVFFNEPGFCAAPSLGILRSTDGGRAWQQMPGAGLDRRSVLSLAVHPFQADTLYAATGGKGVMKSTDGGQTWVVVNKGITTNYARALAVDPTNPQIIYVGTEGEALFKSIDGGVTWKQSSAGLDPHAAIRAIVIDPQQPRILYAGDWRSGAYRSEDGGAQWVQINGALRMRAIRGMAISSDGKHVYAATHGEGTFRLDVGGEPLVVKAAPEPTAAPVAPMATAAVPVPVPAETPASPQAAATAIVPRLPLPQMPGGELCGGIPLTLPPVIFGVFFSVRSRRK